MRAIQRKCEISLREREFRVAPTQGEGRHRLAYTQSFNSLAYLLNIARDFHPRHRWQLYGVVAITASQNVSVIHAHIGHTYTDLLWSRMRIGHFTNCKDVRSSKRRNNNCAQKSFLS